MKKQGITAEDLYPDHIDHHEFNGVVARKGTVSAVMANIEIFESENASPDEKTAALEQIKLYAPVLIATGLHRQVTWKNPWIQKIIDEVANK